VKAFEKWTYEDLIDWAKGHILISIGKGQYQDAVVEVISATNRWTSMIAEKRTRRRKRK
jgi:hypothetical protein